MLKFGDSDTIAFTIAPTLKFRDASYKDRPAEALNKGFAWLSADPAFLLAFQPEGFEAFAEIQGPDERKSKMYRYKGFDSALCGDSMSALEAVVNAWMEAENPRIRHACQSVRDEHILLSFVYEDMRELEQHLPAQVQTTGAIPRFYDDEFIDDRPTNPHVPATPPAMH